MTIARALAVVVALVTAAGCATLNPLPTNACGNGILEPGEDCERSAADATCGAPASAGACRFTCAVGTICPAGYGCGADGICRAPSNHFAADPDKVKGVDAFGLTTGDFDGDGRMDFVARGNRRVQIFGYDGRHSKDTTNNAIEIASLSVTQSLLSAAALGFDVEQTTLQNAMPAVGNFTGADDGTAALALLRPGGFVSVWRTDDDGAFAPKVYSAFGDDTRFILGTGEVLPPEDSTDAASIGNEVLVVGTSKNLHAPALSYIDPRGLGPRELLQLDRGSDAFAGAIVTARFEEQAPCDHVVLAFTGDASVRTFRLCRPAAKKTIQPNVIGAGQIPPASVALAPDYSLGSRAVTAIDFDLDGHLDLVFDGAPKNGADPHATLVAYGLGDGRFHSASFKGGAPPATPDNAAGVAPWLDCGVPKLRGFPLAFGQLTAGDEVVDVVLSRGVCYRTPLGETFVNVGSDVKAAAIGDINGNGLADAVLATSSAIEVFSSTGSYGHRSTYPTPKTVAQLLVADFDGDFVDDIVYRQDEGDSDATVGIYFGQALSVPAPAVSLGRFANVVQVLAGAVNALGAEPDQLTDLGIVSEVGDSAGTRKVAFVRGSTERQLEAPFAIGTPVGGPLGSVQNGARHSFATALGSGHFSKGAGDALAALGVDVADRKVHFWLLPFDKETEVSADATSSPSDDGVDFLNYEWGNARTIACDLFGHKGSDRPVQQLVIAAPSINAAADSALWVARVDDGGKFTLSVPIPIGNGKVKSPYELAAGDFDGDGVDDVAVRSVRAEAPQVLVFFGDGHGGLVQPAAVFDVAGAKQMSIASVRLKGGPALLVATDRQKGEVARVTFDGRVPRLGDVVVQGFQSANAIVASDFDGDGVDDIGVATNEAVSVYWGEPENDR